MAGEGDAVRARSGAAMLREVADRLEEERQLLGVTQEELGRRVGRAQSTVAHALTGERTVPKLDTLVRVAAGLEVEMEVVVRPRRPIEPAEDARFERFSCPCGFRAFGPAGELGFAEWSPERDRWVILVPVGPSAYQLEVESHIARCRIAEQRFHRENC